MCNYNCMQTYLQARDGRPLKRARLFSALILFARPDRREFAMQPQELIATAGGKL